MEELGLLKLPLPTCATATPWHQVPEANASAALLPLRTHQLYMEGGGSFGSSSHRCGGAGPADAALSHLCLSQKQQT